MIAFRQGRVDESIKYLQRFIQVSEESEDDIALSHACSSLGVRLNCLVRVVTRLTTNAASLLQLLDASSLLYCRWSDYQLPCLSMTIYASITRKCHL